MNVKLGKFFPEIIYKNVKSVNIKKLIKTAQLPEESEDEIYKTNEIGSIVPIDEEAEKVEDIVDKEPDEELDENIEEIETPKDNTSVFKSDNPTPFIADNFMTGTIPGGDVRGKHSPELSTQRQEFLRMWTDSAIHFAKNVLGGEFSNIDSWTSETDSSGNPINQNSYYNAMERTRQKIAERLAKRGIDVENDKRKVINPDGSVSEYPLKNYLPTGVFIEFLYKKNEQIKTTKSAYERDDKKAEYETEEQYQNRLKNGLVLHYGFVLGINGPTKSGPNKGKYTIKILDMTYSRIDRNVAMNMTPEEISALQVYQPRAFSLDRMYNVRYSRGSKKTPYLGKTSFVCLKPIRLANRSKIVKAWGEQDFYFNDYIRFQNFLTRKQLYLSTVFEEIDAKSDDDVVCVLKDSEGNIFHPEIFKGTLKELVKQYINLIRSRQDEKIKVVMKNKKRIAYKEKDFTAEVYQEFQDFLILKNLELVLVDPLSPHTGEEVYLIKDNNRKEIYHPEVFHGTLNDIIAQYLNCFKSRKQEKISLVAKKIKNAYKDDIKLELFFKQLEKHNIKMISIPNTNDKFALYTHEISRIPIRDLQGKIISGTVEEIIKKWFELPRNARELDEEIKSKEPIRNRTINVYEFDENGELKKAFRKKRIAQNNINIDNDTSVQVDLPGNSNYTIYINNIIDKALNKLQSVRPDYLKPFTKIINKSSSGQWYGRVSSDAADVIEIDVNRIVTEVQQEIQNQILNQPDIDKNKIINPEELMELASNEIIKQVESIISHETGHNIKDKGFNKSESEAERRQKEIIDLK